MSSDDSSVDSPWDALGHIVDPTSPARMLGNLDGFAGELYELAEQYVGERGSLDVAYLGCGDGEVIFEIAKRLKEEYDLDPANVHLVGIEKSSEMASRAYEKIVQSEYRDYLEVCRGDFKRPPMDDFDVVMAFNSIQESERPYNLLENIDGILGEEGEIWLTFPGRDSPLDTGEREMSLGYFEEDIQIPLINIPIFHDIWVEASLEGYDGFLEEGEYLRLLQFYFPVEIVSEMLQDLGYQTETLEIEQPDASELRKIEEILRVVERFEEENPLEGDIGVEAIRANKV